MKVRDLCRILKIAEKPQASDEYRSAGKPIRQGRFSRGISGNIAESYSSNQNPADS